MIATISSFSTPTQFLSAKFGKVSIPNVEDSDYQKSEEAPHSDFDYSKARALIQSLGQSMGMNSISREDLVNNSEDKSKVFETFSDEAAQRTMERFDVNWMNGNELTAVFVLEQIHGSYDGIRRISDLIALNPKLKTSFYVITSSSSLEGVLTEIHRPIYRLLKRPLIECVRTLDWERLQSETIQLGDRVRYLKSEFLEGISESTAIAEAIE